MRKRYEGRRHERLSNLTDSIASASTVVTALLGTDIISQGVEDVSFTSITESSSGKATLSLLNLDATVAHTSSSSSSVPIDWSSIPPSLHPSAGGFHCNSHVLTFI
jgi:hypothetical protein